MKTFLLIALLILGFTVQAQPPVLRGSMTTNTPLVQLYSMPRFNVVNYGVIPGRTQAAAVNEQVGIQAAIDAAGLAGGGVVFFPKGCYGLGTNFVYPTYLTEGQNSSIIMPSNNVYLMGESPGSVMITQLVFMATGNVIGSGSDTPANGPTNVGLVNIRLCGAISASRDLTQFQRTYNTYFKDCSFESVGQDAIDVQDGGAFFVQNCTFSNVINNAISAQNSEGFIDGFTINGVVGGDMDFFTGKYTVQNGAFYNTTNAINVTSADMVYIDNVIFNNPNVNTTNIHVLGGAFISRCYFSGGGSSGASILANTNSVLYLRDNTFLDRGVVGLRPAVLSVMNNRFSVGNSSIRLQGGSSVMVSGNQFLLATEAIRMTDGVPSHNVQFLNNYCPSAVNYYSDSGGTNPIIIGNYFQDSEIRFQGGEANGYIANNVMKGPAAQFEHSGGGHFVSGNILRDVNFLDTTTSSFANNQIALLSGNATGIAGSGYFGMSGTAMYANGSGITNVTALLTPWTSDINAARFGLTNAGYIRSLTNGSLVALTNGTAQISNALASTAGTISGSNIVQWDNVNTKKTFQHDTNGVTTLASNLVVNAPGVITGNGSGLTSLRASTVLNGGSGSALTHLATGSSAYVPFTGWGFTAQATLSVNKVLIPYTMMLTNFWVANDTGYGAGTNAVFRIYTNGVFTGFSVSVQGVGTATPFSCSNLTSSVIALGGSYLHLGYSNNAASAPASQLLSWSVEGVKQ